MSTSNSNPVLNQLRETADVLGKPQSEVARNWSRSPAMTRSYSAVRNVGVTRSEYTRAQLIMQRLAAASPIKIGA